jgi:hypothetical protein
MQNTWVVIAYKSTNGAITCNGVRKDIKIKDECTLRTKETMLRGERKSIISVKSKFLKTVEPSVANTKITSHHNLSRDEYGPLLPVTSPPVLPAGSMFSTVQNRVNMENNLPPQYLSIVI